ncbi:MAG: extracellular solute-binding protein [Chloroflexaceae bacterium]|nr:extracellular solute-binding protein [Chloroflexaceae bacterium]NJO06592.1 extracellular solute-binding protein [Chloroflexaceae bacterium]
MNTKHAGLSFVVALVLTALLLASCGGGGAPAVPTGVVPEATESPDQAGRPIPTPDEPLRIWGQHDLTNAENPPSVLMNQRIADFEAATGITVEYEQVAWDQLAPKLALAVTSGGDVPDLVEAGSQHIPSLLDAGALMPLDRLFPAADAPWIADMSYTDIVACVYNGERVCISNLVRSSITYYRTADFPDGFPTTSEAWLAAAPELAANDQFMSSFFANREYAAVELTWAQWIYSNGGQIFDAEGKPVWANAQVVEVLEFGRDMFANDYLPEVILTGDFAAAEAPWIDGSAASFRGGTWSVLFVPELDDQLDAGAVGIAGGLSFNGNDPSIFLVAENWVVPMGARNAGGAALWIDQFMEPELLAAWSAAQVGIPTRTAALEVGEFDDPFFVEASTLMAAQGRFMEQSPYYVESLNALAIAIQEIMLDPSIDIQEHLTEAQDDVLQRFW